MSDDPNAAAAVFVMAGLVTPMALRVAATLRLPDHIAAGPRTASELAEAAGADPTTLDRLLRHLATLGIVAGDESGRYRLTDRGEVLRDDHPTGLRRFLEMGSDVAAWAPAIAAAYDWSKLERVTDVGGGNGTLLSALLTEHRGLRGTVVDQPGAAEAARIRLAAAGLSDRADAIAGSFFDPLPTGADGYLLTAIIHDWDDEAAKTILRRCAEAAGRAGRVFVIEKIGTDGVAPNSEMDLRLLAYFGGRERTLAELTALTEASGLTLIEVHASGAIGIVELATS